MTENNQDLSYLSDPRLRTFSSEIFGIASRLPVLGAILELTPVPSSDMVYANQVASLVVTDPLKAKYEFKRTAELEMIRKMNYLEGRKNYNYYYRVETPRWDIIKVALETIKLEIQVDEIIKLD